MKYLTTVSNEPVSIQYDQILNRLNDLLNELQAKLAHIQGRNSSVNDDISFEKSRLELINNFESTKCEINTLIDKREQIQITVQSIDNKVSLINQNIKSLRTNIEQYRLSNNNIDELQVKHKLEILIINHINFLDFRNLLIILIMKKPN